MNPWFEKIFALVLLVSSSLGSCSQSLREAFQKDSKSYTQDLLVSGQGIIWGMDDFLDGRIIFTEREGNIKIYNPKDASIQKLTGVPPVVHQGQGGLLDIQIKSKASKSPWIYFTYACETSPGLYSTRLSRAKVQGEQLTSLEELFTAQPSWPTTHHFGSRVRFDHQGHLFLSVGDRGQRDLAQTLDNHMGKVLRLNLDGSIPEDNPFISQKNARPEIWSYGHRNIQGLFYDKYTKILWEQEHGPRGGDEINQIKKGGNYGWPVITYGREYHGPKVGEGITEMEGMEQPEYYYVPSIAPSGLIMYHGNQFRQWKGSFFSGALAHRHLNRLYQITAIERKEDRMLQHLGKRIRNVMESKDEHIYFSTDNGEIYALRPPKTS
ncbi:MAG: PQQ-dependent sugar dehydrogenase [Bdellovibrionales bacterium]|nr:PQQ-dependent sugar dehydrogenase [Bdellovibrionales bacterium]